MRVTIDAIMALLYLSAIKNDFTDRAIIHLLQLIILILPSGSILPGTLRKFKAYFRKLDNLFTVFSLSYVEKQATACLNTACLKGLSS